MTRHTSMLSLKTTIWDTLYSGPYYNNTITEESDYNVLYNNYTDYIIKDYTIALEPHIKKIILLY